MTTLLLTLTEASEALGGHPSRRTLYRLWQQGEFPARRIGRRLYVARAALEDWAGGLDEIRVPGRAS